MKLIRADKVKAKATDWLWPGRIPRGAITIIEGDPKGGKSTMLADIAARETARTQMPGSKKLGSGGKVLWISGEESPAEIQGKLKSCGAMLSRVSLYDKDFEEPVTLPESAKWLRDEIVDGGFSLVIIDPITSFISGSPNSESSVRAALGPLTVIAEKTGAAIILVRHLRKASGGAAIHRGAGSVGLAGVARSVLLVAPEPTTDEHDPSNCRRVVALVGGNVGPPVRSMAFCLRTSKRGVQFEWVGPSNFTADSLLATTSGDEGPTLMEACHVLFSLLGDGSLWADEAKQLAAQNGVSDRTMKRAKKELGIRTFREGWGRGGRWYWSLPNKDNELITRLRAKAEEMDEAERPEAPDSSLGFDGDLEDEGEEAA